MGCDIHAHAEIKINDRWEHICEVDIGRQYDLFGRLVDGHMRASCSDIKGIAPARGLPIDCNPFTKKKLDNIDFHTHSWLLGTELKKLKKYEDHKTYPIYLDFLEAYKFGLPYEENIFTKNVRIVFAFDS